MEPTPELIDQIYREKVLRARRATPTERLRSGPVLFEMACKWAKASIRGQNPDADEARVLEILKRRLALRHQLERPR